MRRERADRRPAQGVAEALAYPEAQPQLQAPSGRNLALGLRNCRESVLRFLLEPAVPFTHNQAEQDMRMRTVRQKISDGFHSEQGAQALVSLRNVLSSGRKQGRNRLEALLQGPDLLDAPRLA